jgi:hypothetical protein
MFGCGVLKLIRLFPMELHQSRHTHGNSHVNKALISYTAALLGNAEQIESLTPFQAGLLIDLADCQVRGPLHKVLGGFDARTIASRQCRGQARRYAEYAEKKEGVYREVVLAETLGKPLLGDEAQLKVVAGKSVDAVDEVSQGREVVPSFREGGADAAAGQIENSSPDFDGVPSRGLVGPPTRMAVFAVIVRLASDGEYTEPACV